MKANGILTNTATGAEAMAAITGVPLPEQKNWEKKKAAVDVSPNADPLETVPYRVRRSQRQKLVAEAVRRASARGAGRLDASEVLRELIDEWLDKHE